MKKVFTFLLFTIFSSISFSQEKLPATLSDNVSTSKFMNITVRPIGLILGLVQAAADIKVGDHIFVGPSFMYWNIKLNSTSDSLSYEDDIKIKMTGFGANFRYYFNPVFTDGYYVGATYESLNINASTTSIYDGSEVTAELDATLIAGTFGYHWFWESFNQSLGISVGSLSASNIELKDSSGVVVSDSKIPSSSFGVNYSIGFAF